MVVRGKRLGEELQRADCEVMIRGAQRLGLPAAVAKDSATPYVAAGFGMTGDQRHRPSSMACGRSAMGSS